jgi:predicted nucleic acid-binding protein
VARTDAVKLNDALRGVARLGLDTAPLIYLIEAHPTYRPLVRDIARRISDGYMAGITSVVTLGEVLVQPLARGDVALQQQYRDLLLHSFGFRTLPVDAAVAERAAELRARYGMRLPDALQVAVALNEGCEAFLTNDRRLARVREISVLVLDDLVLE